MDHPTGEKTHDSLPAVPPDLQEKIAAAELRLATIAQIVGGDFQMQVHFGPLGGGSFFDTEKSIIMLDPQILLEGKDYLATFVAGHEGGHRAITRNPVQLGMAREKMLELYKKIGFGFLSNCIEDCADNTWVGKIFPQFQEDSDMFYVDQFKDEGAILGTPEIHRIRQRLGYTPKFAQFGSEIIRDWSTGRYSDSLDPIVEKALHDTRDIARKGWQHIPESHASEGKRLKKAKDRLRVVYEKLWPVMEKLVLMDISEEAQRQLAQDMHDQPGRSPLSPEQQQELSDKIGQAQQEAIAGAEQALEDLEQQMTSAQTPEEQQRVSKKIAEQQQDIQKLKSGEEVVVPWSELSDELKEAIKKAFETLSSEQKKKVTDEAKKTLEEIDDALVKETRGSFTKQESTPTHEEIAAHEAAEAEEEAAAIEDARKLRDEVAERERLTESIRKKIAGSTSEYDRIYQDIAPLADALCDRVQKIFLPRRHPRWMKGHPTGQRLALDKVMQFQADRGLFDKLWERKTIPQRIDYCFTLLVDLSGSMQGEKIDQTLRGVILLSEVLNRMDIKTQIVGFQDELLLFKDFDQLLSPEVRTDMTIMREEVYDKGRHNMCRYNSDGYCLDKASRQLEARKAKDKFLVVFSDGIPEPAPRHRGAEYDLHQVIASIRKNTKQKLIGVGLGYGTDHVKTYYPTALPNIDVRRLPELLGDLLEDMIDRPERYR